jgi:hypothetical protein
MQIAYEREANRIWIVNVGDLKPLEIPINHFFDLAYDTELWGYDSVLKWLELWAGREFGSEHAQGISSVVDRYGMYAARRKYEILDPSTYSVINYNEADAVLAQWAVLGKDAQAIYDKLDPTAQAAFYQLVLQPVLGGGVVTQIHVAAGRNLIYAQQKRNSANDAAASAIELFKQDHALTQRYHNLLDGKWNHMLDREYSSRMNEQQLTESRNPSGLFVLAATYAQPTSSSFIRSDSRDICRRGDRCSY